MSLVKIRAALEVGLNGLSPSMSTAFENAPFTPVAGTPYQRVTMLPAKPENPSIGAGLHRELGVLQVMLFYPLNAGSQTATTRAEAIRTLFARGSTWTKTGVTAMVSETPTIGTGRIDGDRYTLAVAIPYHANIFS